MQAMLNEKLIMKMTAFNQTNATEFKMDIYESGNYKTNHRKAKNKE